MKLQMARGVKDYLPDEQIERQRIRDTIRTFLERYGFSPLDTPAIERVSLLSAKYAGGAEIMKEMFTFEDQGGRKLGLRYDLTVPLSRVIGMNVDLKMPFKRYHIDKVWRDGPVATARFREFIQCDADIIGTKSMAAEAELLALTTHVFGDLNLPMRIIVNNRKVLNGLLRQEGVDASLVTPVLMAIDKKDKINKEEMEKELLAVGLSPSLVKDIFHWLYGSLSLEEIANIMTDDEGKEGINELKDLAERLKPYGCAFIFDISLCRGLAYYTGTVFELRLIDNAITSSVGGGGRYDNMIGALLEENRSVPAVGISFGLDRIFEALKAAGRIKGSKTVTQIFVVPVGALADGIAVAEELRKAGFNVETDLAERSISKNLQHANALGIPFTIVIGENEVKAHMVQVKNMSSGEQSQVGRADVVAFFKKALG